MDIYKLGVVGTFPKLDDTSRSILLSIVTRFVSVVFTEYDNDSEETFIESLRLCEGKDIFAVLKIFIPKQIMDQRREIQSFTIPQVDAIKRESDAFYTRTVPKYLNNMFVNWIEVVPSRTGYRTKISLHNDLAIRKDSFHQKARDIAKDRFLNVDPETKYFLTQKPYTDLTLPVDEYLAIKSKYQPWYTFYGLSWLCQLQLFHRYEMNDILLISGETGVGKTSQVPKLLLLAKFIANQNISSGIYMSVPRIIPAVDTAERTRTSMGLKGDDITTIRIKTGKINDQVDRKEKNRISYEIFTDKKLLLTLLNSSKKKINIDVVIDEAHEHNANMDTIISYSYNYYKTKSYWKLNKNKLIIMTATMESDLLKLQNYFNLHHTPYDYLLHIEDPQNEVRYRILETYYPFAIDDNNMITETAKQLFVMIDEMKSYGIDSASILIFIPSENKIKEMIAKIQDYKDQRIIPLPLYSVIDSNIQSIIKDQPVNKITNEHIESIQKETKIKYEDVVIDLLKFKVIVATNIAEASITINGLRGVVETGVEIRLEYNPLLDFYQAKTAKISESSRIQRRGRVGRTSDGFCYYMYPKKYLQDSPIIPKINIEDNIEMIVEGINNFNLNYEDFFNNNFYYIEPSKIKVDTSYDRLNQMGFVDPAYQIIESVFTPINKVNTTLRIDGIDVIFTLSEKLTLASSIKYNVFDEVYALLLYFRYNQKNSKRIINDLMESKNPNDNELLALYKNSGQFLNIRRVSNVEKERIKMIVNDMLHSIQPKISIPITTKGNRILQCFLIGYPQRIFMYRNKRFYNNVHPNKPINCGAVNYKSQFDDTKDIIPARFFSFLTTTNNNKFELRVTCSF